MCKPLFPVRFGFHAAALLLLAGAAFPAAHAQSSTAGQRSKRIATINFGTNGSDPQNTQDPKQRTLQGRVEDANGKGVKDAVVFLKDKKDSSVRSVGVDDAGAYRFVQLVQNHDYQVWAQTDKKKGVAKEISAFDDRTDINLNLHME